MEPYGAIILAAQFLIHQQEIVQFKTLLAVTNAESHCVRYFSFVHAIACFAKSAHMRILMTAPAARHVEKALELMISRNW